MDFVVSSHTLRYILIFEEHILVLNQCKQHYTTRHTKKFSKKNIFCKFFSKTKIIFCVFLCCAMSYGVCLVGWTVQFKNTTLTWVIFFTLNYHSDQNKNTQLHLLANHFPLLAPFLVPVPHQLRSFGISGCFLSSDSSAI